MAAQLQTHTVRRLIPTDEEINSPESETALFEGTQYMMDRLDLKASDLSRILRVPASTVRHWLKNKRIPLGNDYISNDAESVLHLIAIHRSLEAMLETPEAQIEWLRTFRPDINAVPIKKLSESFQSLLSVRQYLDYARGRGA